MVPLFLVAACATPQPPVPAPASLFHDDLFAPAQRINADEVFALSESMRRYLHDELPTHVRTRGTHEALIHVLYTRGQLKLDYDAAITRNAAQAFEARAGNCLSLVLMTAAFAKELGLPVRYQSAYVEDAWIRSGDLLLRSGHVNVTLGPKLGELQTRPFASPMTIDFLPADEIRGLRVRDLDEDTIVAMYMNNRAAESLTQGDLDAAYAWVKAAIYRGPGFVGAYNTLGVVYSRRGEPVLAERVFGYALERDSNNTRVMSNLARTLARLGKIDAAEALYRRLAQLEPQPPFHFFSQGQEAYKRKDFLMARDLFVRELARADYNPEFHFWLALTHFQLDDVASATRHLKFALEFSATRGDRDLYAAKLAWLKAHDARPQ